MDARVSARPRTAQLGVKVEWKDREEASGTYKLVWDKCNCCWCLRYLYMHSSRAYCLPAGFG